MRPSAMICDFGSHIINEGSSKCDTLYFIRPRAMMHELNLIVIKTYEKQCSKF